MTRSVRLPVPVERIAQLATLPLELGGTLRDVTVRGTLYGRPLGTAPVVVVEGGITANHQPFGDGREPGWWPSLLRRDLCDPARHTILAPAVLGNGSDWFELRSAGGESAAPLPSLTPFDLAEAIERWLRALECTQRVTFIGASVGGLVGLALALRHPCRVHHLVTISASLRPDGWGTGIRHLQRELVRDGLMTGHVALAMRRARELGMLTYRGRAEINSRFGRLAPGQAMPPIASYLEHHGTRFAERFSAHRFLLLSEAIDRFHVGDTPTLRRAALRRIHGRVTVVGVPGDLLFPWEFQDELHLELRAAGVASHLLRLESIFGHDAFLADQDALATLLGRHGMMPQEGADPPDALCDCSART